MENLSAIGMDSAVEAIPDAADAHDVSGLGRLWFDFAAERDDVVVNDPVGQKRTRTTSNH